MITTLFIGQQQFRDLTPVSLNLDEKWFRLALGLAQTKYIECELGKELTAELKDQIDNSTLTPANEALLEQIAPAMAWWAYLEALPEIQYRAEDLGMRINTDANSQPLTGTQMAHRAGNIRNNAEHLTNILRQFLKDNKDNYPLWDQACCQPCAEGASGTFKVVGKNWRLRPLYSGRVRGYYDRYFDDKDGCC